MPNRPQIYDLKERTAKFGESIIGFAKQIPKNPVTIPLITQITRSGTSVGANYHEADCAETKRDFEHKLGICKKEANETKHWLRMIAAAIPDLTDASRVLWQEAHELTLIFSASVRTSQQKDRVNPLEIRN
jgi:four helix bundle protein